MEKSAKLMTGQDNARMVSSLPSPAPVADFRVNGQWQEHVWGLHEESMGSVRYPRRCSQEQKGQNPARAQGINLSSQASQIQGNPDRDGGQIRATTVTPRHVTHFTRSVCPWCLAHRRTGALIASLVLRLVSVKSTICEYLLLRNSCRLKGP
jgi:hypothetical protein